MESRRIEPARRALDALVRAVPSKSVTHRALVAAALARGTSRVRLPLDADDTRRTRDALCALGIEVRVEGGDWVVVGASGRIPGGGRAFLGDSGTTLRFLTAVAALGARESRLDGSERLRERPIAELGRALRTIGGRIVALGAHGGLPLVAGGSAPHGGSVDVEADRSSQFASALLLIAPVLSDGLDLRLLPPAVSTPYVELTLAVLEAFGARIRRPEPFRFVVEPGGLSGRVYRVEGDHSSASYFLAAAALCGGRVCVTGLDPRSRQADAAFAGMLESIGCRVRAEAESVEVAASGRIPGFEIDAGDCPDVVPTLAALAAHAEGPCVIRGVPHLKWKESDRLEVLAENLCRLGRPAVADGSSLRVDTSQGDLRPATIRTASDHRIAMAFAVAGLRSPLSIDDPACVAKSYPAFWDDFGTLTA
jgi:3-phosphoshikimate 1-carboxyvinyltransferase